MTTEKPSPEELRSYGYAPGNYTCVCYLCKEDFVGDKRALACLKCATAKVIRNRIIGEGSTNNVETEPAENPLNIDSLRTMRNKIDGILEEEVQRSADLVMKAIEILGEAKLMPQQTLGRGQFLFMIAPEVYEEIIKRSASMKNVTDLRKTPG